MEPSIQEPYFGLNMPFWIKGNEGTVEKILQYNYGTKPYPSHSTLYSRILLIIKETVVFSSFFKKNLFKVLTMFVCF